jgi:type VI secretion system protein
VAAEMSLLERIDAGDGAAQRGTASDTYALSRSVLAHVRKMLNVRQGNVAALPDFGLPDINDLAYRHGNPVPELKKAIKQCVERFEPRLTKVRVRYAPDPAAPLDLRFEVAGQVSAGGESSPVVFETTVNGAGHVRVRG